MRSRMVHTAIAGLVIAGVAVLAPAAGARTTHVSHAAAALTLLVNYSFTGEITVELPNGTPVGVHGGQPTVISAGYYNVELNQPGCVDTPAFIMQGPGVNILDDMQSGEIVTDAVSANLQPNSTYTWRDGSINPPVVYTFVTNDNVVGTPPSQAVTNPFIPSKNKQQNASVVGSATGVLGSLTATLDSAGTLRLAGPHALGAGRYSLTVTDESSKKGAVLLRPNHKPLTLTAAGFVGRHKTSVDLTAGTWVFESSPGGAKTSVVVS